MAARSFVNTDGTSWQAWDVVPGQHSDWPTQARRHLPDALGTGWLCFETAGEKRRLHPIPTAWEHWSDEELRRLCDDATPVHRRNADAVPTSGSRPHTVLTNAQS